MKKIIDRLLDFMMGWLIATLATIMLIMLCIAWGFIWSQLPHTIVIGVLVLGVVGGIFFMLPLQK